VIFSDLTRECAQHLVNKTTVKLAFRAPPRAPRLDDSYSQIPVSDDHLHTDADYSVDDYLSCFQDREGIERDWCARISVNSPSPGLQDADTPSPLPRIQGLEKTEKHQSTLCWRSRRLTHKSL
jgi:hypothetical protein